MVFQKIFATFPLSEGLIYSAVGAKGEIDKGHLWVKQAVEGWLCINQQKGRRVKSTGVLTS